MFFFVKVFGGILLTYTFFFYALPVNNWNPVQLFGAYIKAAYIVAIIGILQIFSFIIGFTEGANFSWLFDKWSYSLTDEGFLRLNSVLMEPSSYAMIMAPPTFIALYNLFFRKQFFITKFQSYIFILTYILTQSGNSLSGIAFMFLLLSLNNLTIGRFFITIIVGFILLYATYLNSESIKIRVDSSLLLFNAPIVNDEFIRNNDIHGSSYILYENIQVALKNSESYPFTGTGIGSHPFAFEKYKTGISNATGNLKDGNSLLVRVVSETGLLGVLLLFGFIFNFFVKKTEGIDESYWLISNGCLIVILLFCQRQGNYFVNGFPFFIWLYYGTKKWTSKNKLSLNA